MSAVIVVVAGTEGSLAGVASEAHATLIDGTAVQFASLEFYPGTGYGEIGDIDTDKGGWVGLAKKS